jgi:hypothetical protein
VSPLSLKEIENFTDITIEYLSPELLRKPGSFPILHFFDHILPDEFGLDCGVTDLSDGVEGMTLPDGQVLVSEETYRRASEGVGRARFTVAHECFHGIQHRDQIQRALVDTGELVLHRRGELKPFLDPEWQANEFAGALLMPRRAIAILREQHQRLLLPLVMAETFEVSVKAAEVRLGILEK